MEYRYIETYYFVVAARKLFRSPAHLHTLQLANTNEYV